MRHILTLSLVCTILAISALNVTATPIVTFSIVKGIDGTNDAYDIWYAPEGQTAEFTQIRVTAEAMTPLGAPGILDPIKAARSSEGGNAVDTWVNTVGSLFGAGAASYTTSAYNPGGFNPDPAPTAKLDWTAFDTLTGDSAGNIGQLPWHLGRIMVTPDAMGTLSVLAYDTQTDSAGARFETPIGVPEPSTFALIGMSLVGLVAFARKRK